jgi:hypothetical protein
MRVTFNVTIVKELARITVSLSHPLRWLPVNWTSILVGSVVATSCEGKRNQSARKKDNFLGHLA